MNALLESPATAATENTAIVSIIVMIMSVLQFLLFMKKPPIYYQKLFDINIPATYNDGDIQIDLLLTHDDWFRKWPSDRRFVVLPSIDENLRYDLGKD